MEKNAYYLNTLKEHLSQKQRLNPHYSLRAFARDLEMHPSTLSSVFRNQRSLPFKDSKKVAKKLNLSPKEETLFLESLFQIKTKLDKIEVSESSERYMLDESHFKVISEWEHYAVLMLFDVKGFTGSIAEITKKLKISSNRAEVVVEHLIVSGLIKEDENGKMNRVHFNMRTTEDIKSQALHMAHRETMEIGLKKLEEINVELRDFSESVMAIDLEKITEAKTIIREFRQKMAALLRDGNKTEVYQLAIQFYPLTQIETPKDPI